MNFRVSIWAQDADGSVMPLGDIYAAKVYLAALPEDLHDAAMAAIETRSPIKARQAIVACLDKTGKLAEAQPAD